MLDLVLPPRCVVCGENGTQLCSACAFALPALCPPWCERCGAPTAWPVARCRECSGRRLGFATARAAVAYEGEVRRLVAAWKERGLRRLADAAAAIVVERLPAPEAQVLTFVPADADRRRHRGHHPAALLAEALAERWQLPCVSQLVRTQRSARQRGLSLAERRRNVADAFRAESALGGCVLLVDDVYTSGATASAAAFALCAVGAERVDVVTFARAIRMSGVGLQGRRTVPIGGGGMQLYIKGKNLDVSDSIRSYAERKLSKLNRQLSPLAEVEVELAVEKNPSIADNQVAEATVRLKGHTLRAREASADMKASIHELAQKLLRQVKAERDKKKIEPRRTVDKAAADGEMPDLPA